MHLVMSKLTMTKRKIAYLNKSADDSITLFKGDSG